MSPDAGDVGDLAYPRDGIVAAVRGGRHYDGPDELGGAHALDLLFQHGRPAEREQNLAR
jgi:hypothetical protein